MKGDCVVYFGALCLAGSVMCLLATTYMEIFAKHKNNLREIDKMFSPNVIYHIEGEQVVAYQTSDESHFRKIKRILECLGTSYDVTYAKDSTEFIHQMMEKRPDLLLSWNEIQEANE